MSLDPTVVFVGGSASEHQTVNAAVDRFVGAGLALPDLVIRIHSDAAQCDGRQGLFHFNGGSPVIDLCYEREFLALHELGHAWERFNLDDQSRQRFQDFVGSPTWRAADTYHGHRAVEIAANALAHGLLSVPLQSGQHRDLEFAQFEALTGIPTPRLTETQPDEDRAPTGNADDNRRVAGHETWRRAAALPLDTRSLS